MNLLKGDLLVVGTKVLFGEALNLLKVTVRYALGSAYAMHVL